MINYYLLTKPGIIMGNLITVAAGFILGSKGKLDFQLFLVTVLAMTLIMASACIFNNYIDRELDQKMKRTQNRGFAKGRVQASTAIILAMFFGLIGHGMLLVFTNILTFALAATGFFVYVVLYSLWKSKTVYGTAIGSVAGAIPCVVGYAAVSNRFDAIAMILFAMMVLWQMPHFFAIALFHFDDYSKGGIPVLPIVKGVFRTKVHMLIYIVLFVLLALMLPLLGVVGSGFFIAMSGVGAIWLGASIKGFWCVDDVLWGKQMFRLSLAVITVFSFFVLVP